MISGEHTSITKNDLLEKKSLFDEYLKKSRYQLSSFSFINIFIWSDFFDFQFETIDDNLCILAKNEVGCFLYLPPLGNPMSSNALHACFENMAKVNKGSSVTRIENVDGQQMTLFEEQEYSIYKKCDEYVYLREDIAQLKGNRFKSKRSSHNHFVKHFQFEYLPFTPGMQKGCEELYEQWVAGRRKKYADEIYGQMLEDNRGVHYLAMQYQKELGLVGRIVKVAGKIRAYSFGFALKDDVFCVLFEIADLEVKGLPVFIFSEFCRDQELTNFKWVNCMDDFGAQKIASTKSSFHPAQVLPVYTVTRKTKTA